MSAVKTHELKPSNAHIKLNGKEYELRSFDLLAQSWAHREFATETQPEGMFNLADKLRVMHEDLSTLIKCCWHLLKQKSDFGSLDGFERAVIAEGKRRQSEIEVYGELVNALNYTLGVSSITEDDIREDDELKKPSRQDKLNKRLVLLGFMIVLPLVMVIVWRSFLA